MSLSRPTPLDGAFREPRSTLQRPSLMLFGRPNPAAATLMTRMEFAAHDRPRVKLECLRILAGLKLERSRLRFLIGFGEQYLALTPEEAGIFQCELEHSDIQPKERRAMMDLTNSWEQKGIERGRHEGLEQGRNEGLQLAILRLARSRFQPPESDLFSAVNQVTTPSSSPESSTPCARTPTWPSSANCSPSRSAPPAPPRPPRISPARWPSRVLDAARKLVNFRPFSGPPRSLEG